jgi:hypothetical protein
MVSAAGLAPATSTSAEWRSDLTGLRGQKFAFVAGLAPTKAGLKIRALELLCIHEHEKWSPRLGSHQRLLVFSEALICLSYLGVETSGFCGCECAGLITFCLQMTYNRMTL